MHDWIAGRHHALLALAGAWLVLSSGAQARDAATLAIQDTRLSAAVEIRRTADRIPHLKAQTWRDLGHGVGYVQAEDALCTMAEAFVTYEGRRSRFFGTDAKPAHNSTFGRQTNLDLDTFFRVVADEAAVRRYREEQPEDFTALLEGFADGFNHYLAEARRGAASRASHSACLTKAWVRDITADDLYRRMIAAGVAGGYTNFIAQLVNAKPPTGRGSKGAKASPHARAQLSELFAYTVGDQAALGSNAIALGRQATGEEGSVLLGNPHWYWGGPDRFYQMHLQIPGKLNVAGAAFLGVPVVMVGFNEHVAWSHTVSEARRFGIFDLTLEPGSPERYLVDGKSEAMQLVSVEVETTRGRGAPATVSRTVYRTRFGLVADFGAQHPAFGWTATNALAVRDINEENRRIFRNFFYWNQAGSLDEFMAIQRREGAVPWVNTIAIGRGDGRVWYADIGPVPNVSQSLRETCATPLSQAFSAIDPRTPFLDGSRSACDWQADPRAVQAGAMPVEAMPQQLREDYVANMNDSHWLTNVAAPLEGYPTVIGAERQDQSLRTKLGHRIAQQTLALPAPHTSQAVSRALMHDALHPRVHSAERFKDELLSTTCAPSATAKSVKQACDVLKNWNNTGNAQDRGALLWESFWARLQAIPGAELYQVPFSFTAPLDTPARPNGADPRVRKALEDTVAAFNRQGRPLDQPLGARRFVRSGGHRVPLYGGCHDTGYFTVACNDDGPMELGPNSVANSYMQVVRFTAQGVEAHTLLAHGQRETAVSNGSGGAPVTRYAVKSWLRFPFTEAEIAADADLEATRLLP